MKPTTQQQAIIDCATNTVIIASPGSGKTYVISERIRKELRLLKEHQGVIAISYTNKASIELKNRCLSNGFDAKNSFFGTIDKFCISEIIIPFGKLVLGLPTTQINVLRSSDINPEFINENTWIQSLASIDELDDDIIEVLRSEFISGRIYLESVGLLSEYLIAQSEACRKYLFARYKSIYIDEYQDSGASQHRLFLAMQELGITAIAVGDSNQSIFEFSGKSSKYLLALSSIKGFRSFILNKNHRCHDSIINYSNRILNKNASILIASDIRVCYAVINGGEAAIAAWIDNNIAHIMSKYGVDSFSEVAILCKSKRTCEIIDNAMISPHIYVASTELDTDFNIWSSIFSDLLKYTFSSDQLFFDILDHYGNSERMAQKNQAKLASLKDALDKTRTHNTIDPNAVSDIYINVARIISPTSENTVSKQLLLSVLNDDKLLKTYSAPSANSINILTIHKAKGLEFDVAINVDLYEWIFPQKQPGANNDFDNPIFTNYQQDLNLHYVGVTRARKYALLVSSTTRINHQMQIRRGVESEFLRLNGTLGLRTRWQ